MSRLASPRPPISVTTQYDPDEMAERGRRGGLAKAERARPSVTLTGAEAAALADAYRLLGGIVARNSAAGQKGSAAGVEPAAQEGR